VAGEAREMMSGDYGCAMGRIEQMIRYTYWSSGSTGIVIGISGGIDSAVCASFCCRAIGGDHVLGLTLPSDVTTEQDLNDAADLCSLLGMEHHIISIDPILRSVMSIPGYTGSPYLRGNLMARIRMTLLYYHANRDSRLVCGTSNRTEFLLGYCTKFGDNAADIQPIMHLYKTDVMTIAGEIGIPEAIRRKKPSAGLWTGQTDEGEIGLSYSAIDAALQALERNGWESRSPDEERVLGMVRKSEHKRLPPQHLLSVC
jgi:NAD+ synthase